MPVFNLFSKRQRQLREEPSDILTYDTLPNALRIQLSFILKDAFGKMKAQYNGYGNVEKAYKFIHDLLCREYGVEYLTSQGMYEDSIHTYLRVEKDVERVMDVVGVSMNYLERVLDDSYEFYVDVKLDKQGAIDELNARFKEHAIGYQYENQSIIRVDSTYIHDQIVKPTLQLLHNPLFDGVNEEYLKAHEHYRHGRNKESLTECLKAFESALKIIFTNKGWAFNPTATASALINVAFTNDLVPSYLQSQLTALRSLLESGIPTLRNKLGGHGQGATPTTVDDETARYGLNLTGSNIIYLIELSKI